MHSISHTGNTTLSLSSSTFKLKNVHVIPSMRKNLLFISQFCNDNHVFCAFDAHNFNIFELTFHSLLFQDHYRNGLYKIPAQSIRLMALSVPHNSFHLWLRCFGHPSSKVLSNLCSSKLLPSKFRLQSSFCKGCALGKSTCLLFASSNEIMTIFPFTLIHLDVWQSPALSSSGFILHKLHVAIPYEK